MKECRKGYRCGKSCIEKGDDCGSKLPTGPSKLCDSVVSNIQNADVVLGRGQYGEVRLSTDRKYAIKKALQGTISNSEINLTRKAGELGVGPKVISGNAVELVMEYLEDFALVSSLSSVSPDLIDKAYKTIEKLHKEGGIHHEDIHGGNLLYHPTKGFRIIDYGIAKEYQWNYDDRWWLSDEDKLEDDGIDHELNLKTIILRDLRDCFGAEATQSYINKRKQ